MKNVFLTFTTTSLFFCLVFMWSLLSGQMAQVLRVEVEEKGYSQSERDSFESLVKQQAQR